MLSFEVSPKGRWILLGVAAPTTALLLYWLLKTSNEEEDYTEQKKASKAATSRQTVIEVAIPRKLVGTVIGRQGATIKELQEKSGARMNFKDNPQGEDADRTLIIRGSAENAQRAECLVREILADVPVLVEEVIMVPQYSLGRLIGKGGEVVRQMQRSSSCKIYIERTTGPNKDQPRKVTLTGTTEQIVIAKALIQEQLYEEEQFRARTAVSAANKEPRIQRQPNKHGVSKVQGNAGNTNTKSSTMNGATSPDVSESQCSRESVRTMSLPKGPEYLEVYVSAIAHPGAFWVQLIGSTAVKLDQLSESMTRFYETTGKDLTLPSVKKGDLVAAPFENDNTWYRARVMDVQVSELDVFYVDYGDSAYLDASKVKPLSAEYLELPLQAIECRLHGVEPTPGGWSDATFERFEQLTYCAKWKVIMAQLIAYEKDIASLVLYDTNKEQDVNINDELVKCGLALASGSNGNPGDTK
ncbi:tudor and KH domain-containing protein-like [Dreissena polymorpha]|uniref:Tudor domain-containing protein n=1 Tax=Dreissena polymorpha TaxID=45954 RepID=A0A9D4DT15_DREPO|nr:tudor and KH domain-containing protein-like [Dreissena polymorpha]KAH3753334.1 hypothetical protein DPMN_187969 [Dreissena polymorpha]